MSQKVPHIFRYANKRYKTLNNPHNNLALHGLLDFTGQ